MFWVNNSVNGKSEGSENGSRGASLLEPGIPASGNESKWIIDSPLNSSQPESWITFSASEPSV